MDVKVRSLSDITIMTIIGSLDIERAQHFRDFGRRTFQNMKLVFNMEKALFVGSTGIQAFLETLEFLNEKNSNGIRLVSLRPEFKRIIQNLDYRNVFIHDSEMTAIRSFTEKTEIVAPVSPDLSESK